MFVEVNRVVFLHLPRLLYLHPALLGRLLQHVQLLLDLGSEDTISRGTNIYMHKFEI